VRGRARPIWSKEFRPCGGISVTACEGPFSPAEVPFPERLLFERLLNFSPLPAIAKSVFFNSCLCLRRIHHQNPPNEASKTTRMGTTIAGIKVARFPEPPEDSCEDVAAAVAEVLEEVADAREAASAEVMEA
jgi:hypothetical protein